MRQVSPSNRVSSSNAVCSKDSRRQARMARTEVPMNVTQPRSQRIAYQDQTHWAPTHLFDKPGFDSPGFIPPQPRPRVNAVGDLWS